MNPLNNLKRQNHLESKILCMSKELNKCLKKTDMGYFQRRRFLGALRGKMKTYMLGTWYPNNPSFGAEDRVFTLRPMHWTIRQAAVNANIKREKIENFFFGIESFSIHPTVGLVKYYNIPSKVIYDDEELLNTFDSNKMEKRGSTTQPTSSKNTWTKMKKKKNLYVGALGSNPTDDERALKVSTALTKLHQNNLELCNVCKHINVNKVIEMLKDETTKTIAIQTTIAAQKTIRPPPTEICLVPTRNIREDVNLDEKYCGYEIITDDIELEEEKLQGGQKQQQYRESTLI